MRARSASSSGGRLDETRGGPPQQARAWAAPHVETVAARNDVGARPQNVSRARLTIPRILVARIGPRARPCGAPFARSLRVVMRDQREPRARVPMPGAPIELRPRVAPGSSSLAWRRGLCFSSGLARASLLAATVSTWGAASVPARIGGPPRVPSARPPDELALRARMRPPPVEAPTLKAPPRVGRRVFGALFGGKSRASF